MKNQTELLKQLKTESARRQSEWGKEKVLDYVQMCSRGQKAAITDDKAQFIKKAWQSNVAEVQRAQMTHRSQLEEKEKIADMNYGQNLIKQLGYRRPQDKKHTSEPNGTLYDYMFTSRVHASVENAKKIDGTKSHQVTKHMKDKKEKEMNRFSQKHVQGGTLLEQHTNQREDEAWSKKVNTQAATALELKRQMQYRQGLFKID